MTKMTKNDDFWPLYLREAPSFGVAGAQCQRREAPSTLDKSHDFSDAQNVRKSNGFGQKVAKNGQN